MQFKKAEDYLLSYQKDKTVEVGKVEIYSANQSGNLAGRDTSRPIGEIKLFKIIRDYGGKELWSWSFELGKQTFIVPVGGYCYPSDEDYFLSEKEAMNWMKNNIKVFRGVFELDYLNRQNGFIMCSSGKSYLIEERTKNKN